MPVPFSSNRLGYMTLHKAEAQNDVGTEQLPHADSALQTAWTGVND